MDAIANADLVSRAMGYWPSFHDAEVIGFQRHQETLTIRIHVWELTPEVDNAGFFGKRNQHIVTLEALGVTQVEGPAEPDLFGTLFELRAERGRDRVTLTLDGVCNEGTVVVRCSGCRVAAVDPHDQ